MKRICGIIVLFLCTQVMGQQVFFESNGIVYGVTSESSVEVLASGNNPYSGAVTIPQTVSYNGTDYTVTALGESAFESCRGLTALNLPATIRSFGSYCLYGYPLPTLQLPDSLRSIGDHAFLYSDITSLHLPAQVEEFGESAFWTTGLTSITVDEANQHFRSIGGWLYSKDSLTLCVVPDGVGGVINVPSFVRHIGYQAFGFNSHATSVSLPEGLVSIGDFAFNCCSNVNNIVIPSTVKRLGNCPFSYCPQLTNLSIANGNTNYVTDGVMIYSIGYDTLISCHKSGATVTLNPNLKVLGGFENNSWVRNISIPAGVTELMDNCFNGCSLTSIALPAHMTRIGALAFGENSKLTSVTMPETLLSMGEGAFSWCSKLTSIVIPDSLRIIPKEAFNSCPRLSSITWGNAVEEIGYASFWSMAAEFLDLPETVRKIDDYAFAACANNLRGVTIRGQVDTMGESVFRSANLDFIEFKTSNPPAVIGAGPIDQIGRLLVINIPCGSGDAWLADSYWGQFADRLQERCGGVDDATDDDAHIYTRSGCIVVAGAEGRSVSVFDAIGRKIYHTSSAAEEETVKVPSEGVYVVRVEGSNAKKVLAVM